jgi:hypothetical protein
VLDGDDRLAIGLSYRIHACGLVQAALRMAEHLAKSDKTDEPISLPLIASNPAAAFRGAGFGGGDFEVDQFRSRVFAVHVSWPGGWCTYYHNSILPNPVATPYFDPAENQFALPGVPDYDGGQGSCGGSWQVRGGV